MPNISNPFLEKFKKDIINVKVKLPDFEFPEIEETILCENKSIIKILHKQNEEI